MLAILADRRSGEVNSYEVPQPELHPAGILVRTAFSAISAGTERADREQAEKSLIARALDRPDLVRRVLDLVRTEGLTAAYQHVQSLRDTVYPLGYSCAGVVIAAGQNAHEFQPGDRVACGGVGYANHCEINFVPKNLAVRVPNSVPLDAASLTTIGAIALQGFRQSQAVLGETVAVIGAGLVGVLTIQLAKAAGCRVVAIDIDSERAHRAGQLGADLALCPTNSQTPLSVKKLAGDGVDVAIVTAATESTEPINLAANIVRDRGRIVVVGAVGLGISRQIMYSKELSLALSRSYGPGRYDPRYEEDGIDYPIGYVRWTEKRNMEAFVQLLASGSINVAPLIERRCSVKRGEKAYCDLNAAGAYTVLIEYDLTESQRTSPASNASRQVTKLPVNGELRIGCIGGGAFARNVIFPALRRTRGVALQSVATASGVAAESARNAFKFHRAVTPTELLQDTETDAVFVISSDDSHAQYVVASLANQKPVFVEKPLAINREQLDAVRCTYQAEQEKSGTPFLMVGFNRRFAPFTEKLQHFFDNRSEPMMVHVRVNAGYIPLDHSIQRGSNGGRIVGELCHFVDWARAIIGVPIISITAQALPDGVRYNHDNVAATLSFRDGSIANLLYVANGDKCVPKEHFEVFCEGKVGCVHDFRTLELTANGKTQRMKGKRDKGHTREVELTVDAMRRGGQSPIPYEQIAEVSEATIAILEAITDGQSARSRITRFKAWQLRPDFQTT